MAMGGWVLMKKPRMWMDGMGWDGRDDGVSDGVKGVEGREIWVRKMGGGSGFIGASSKMSGPMRMQV